MYVCLSLETFPYEWKYFLWDSKHHPAKYLRNDYYYKCITAINMFIFVFILSFITVLYIINIIFVDLVRVCGVLCDGSGLEAPHGGHWRKLDQDPQQTLGRKSETGEYNQRTRSDVRLSVTFLRHQRITWFVRNVLQEKDIYCFGMLSSTMQVHVHSLGLACFLTCTNCMGILPIIMLVV